MTAVIVPTFIAVLVALPFWFSRRNAFVGSVVGAGLIFASVLGFVAREFIIFAAQRQECFGTRGGCDGLSSADGFVRFATYGIIGMFDVAVVFVLSNAVEKWRANRGVEQKWRS